MPISVHDWGGWRKGGWQQLSTVLAYYAVWTEFGVRRWSRLQCGAVV